MYDKLIKRLRNYSEGYVAYKTDSDFAYAVQQAADAIEELSKEAARWQAEAKDWYLAYMDLLPTRWIPVTERLPPLEQDVLVLAYGNMIRVWCLHRLDPETADVCWECEDGSWDDVCVVTHWQPLPELPKEVDDGQQT